MLLLFVVHSLATYRQIFKCLELDNSVVVLAGFLNSKNSCEETWAASNPKGCKGCTVMSFSQHLRMVHTLFQHTTTWCGALPGAHKPSPGTGVPKGCSNEPSPLQPCLNLSSLWPYLLCGEITWVPNTGAELQQCWSEHLWPLLTPTNPYLDHREHGCNLPFTSISPLWAMTG